MQVTIRIVLPEGVGVDMPFVGAGVLTLKQAAQIRPSEPLPPRILEIARTADALEWRYGSKTYSTLLSDVHKGSVGYGTFMGMPFLEFALLDQSDGGGYSLMTYGHECFSPSSAELGLEDWFREFARVLDPIIPGGVAIKLDWPLKS